MPDELKSNKGQIPRKFMAKKKNNIRVFVQRKRLSTKLTSIIEKNSKRNKKNIIVINYKPVFVRPRPTPINENSPSTPPPSPNRWFNKKTTPSSDPSKTNYLSNRESIPLDVPDVEDPLVFIEMMYQQLFTEDGQLRSGTEPTIFANRMKQIVTQSRRNSMVHRDSLSSNIHQQRYSSFSSSQRFPRYTFSEDEEPHTVLQRNRTANTSRRSSKQSSIDHGDHHQQQLNAFLNSYYHHQKHSTINTSSPFSIDDTDNEDLDTFSDLNSYRKTMRMSPPASIDEDTTLTDSKHLSSSGYQSLKSPQPKDPPQKTETKQYCCPNCTQIPSITILPSPITASSINLIQPIREIFVKYMNFILISKNILLVPLFIFFLRQR